MLKIARSTVQDNLKRAAMAGLSWPLASDLIDDVLEAKLSSAPASSRGSDYAKARLGSVFDRAEEEARRDAADPLGKIPQHSSRRIRIAIGEHCGPWWDDGAPDYNRHMAKSTPYAKWFAGFGK